MCLMFLKKGSSTPDDFLGKGIVKYAANLLENITSMPNIDFNKVALQIY